MLNQGRIKQFSFAAITALAGLLIVIVSAHTLFPELIFYGIAISLVAIMVILIVYAFIGEHASLYISRKRWERKQNILSKKYFEDFKDFVKAFCNLPEFNSPSLGIISILNDLPPGKSREKETEVSFLISRITDKFSSILFNPVNTLKQKLFELSKSQINRQVLSQYVRQFEDFIQLHKSLYVDESVIIAGKIGVDNITKSVKIAYANYKEEYNHFINTYTEFAKKASRELGIFNQYLKKMYEL